MKSNFKFVVIRDKWARGRTNVSSELLNIMGNMCCLGFLGKACGYNDEDLKQVPSPGYIVYEYIDGKVLSKFPSSLVMLDAKHPFECRDTPACRNLMKINDDEEISDQEREKLLTEKFLEIGIEVEFK